MRIVLCLALLVAACSTDSRSGGNNNNNNNSNSTGKDGGTGSNPDLFVKVVIDDPFPPYCGPDDSMTPPPQPGGTVDCPDDKNLQGCPCDEIGKEAPCFPGLRANRNLGQCKDGVATCEQSGELAAYWGECKGAVLPDPNETAGAAACKCFSSGYWNVNNLSVCGSVSGTTYSAWGAAPPVGNMIDCSIMPSGTWTTDTLKVDCAGHFKLCFTVRAGDWENPKSSDCIIKQVCAEDDYLVAGQTQTWPPLAAWSSSNSSCIEALFTTGGYGQMSVVGESVTCDTIADHVFQTIRYCGSDEPGCNTGPVGGPFGN